MKLLLCPHCQDVRKLSPGQPNQCDGCKQGAIRTEDLHRDANGHAFMVCQRERYGTYCTCGKSWGYYADDINAVYGGDAVMLGISNFSLADALKRQKAQGDRPDGLGRKFDGFIIPESAPTVRREK